MSFYKNMKFFTNLYQFPETRLIKLYKWKNNIIKYNQSNNQSNNQLIKYITQKEIENKSTKSIIVFTPKPSQLLVLPIDNNNITYYIIYNINLIQNKKNL